MKKLSIILLLAFICIVSTLLNSCKKSEVLESTSTFFSTKNKPQVSWEKTEVLRWLSNHTNDSNSNYGKKLIEIQKNLNFENSIVLNRKNGDKVLAISIGGEFNKTLNLKSNYSLKLLVVKNSSGKLRWSSIVAFQSSDRNESSESTESTLSNIIDNKPITQDGEFRFYNLNRRLLFLTEFKNGKLIKYGSVQREDTLSDKQKKAASRNRSAARGGCINWYLITTIYYEDGSTDVDVQYLFTTCDEDNDGGGGAGGGDNPGDPGDPEGPEEPVDLELSSERAFNLAEQNYTDDDIYQQDNDGQIEYDDNGEALPPYTGPSRVDYECRVWITYVAVSREITSAFPRDVIARPNWQQYYNPGKGQTVRTVTPVTLTKYADIQGTTALCHWSWLTTFRWTYLSSGTTFTRGYPGTFTAPVTAN